MVSRFLCCVVARRDSISKIYDLFVHCPLLIIN